MAAGRRDPILAPVIEMGQDGEVGAGRARVGGGAGTRAAARPRCFPTSRRRYSCRAFPFFSIYLHCSTSLTCRASLMRTCTACRCCPLMFLFITANVLMPPCTSSIDLYCRTWLTCTAS